MVAEDGRLGPGPPVLQSVAKGSLLGKTLVFYTLSDYRLSTIEFFFAEP